jgi:hypothetical protein
MVKLNSSLKHDVDKLDKRPDFKFYKLKSGALKSRALIASMQGLKVGVKFKYMAAKLHGITSGLIATEVDLGQKGSSGSMPYLVD